MIHRLLIYFTASERVAGWRVAISTVAQHHGWIVLEEDPLDPLALANDASVIVMGPMSRPHLLIEAGFTPIVVCDSPVAALAALAQDGGRDAMKAAAYEGSILFAAASEMAALGAIVVDARASTLDLPGLTEVRFPETAAPAIHQTALDIYNALPPTVGARAQWPLDAFNYPLFAMGQLSHTSPCRIDLTGRARTLVYGPYTILSPGTWCVQAQVAVEPDGGMSHLRFDWGTDPDFVQVVSSVSHDGVYSIALEHDWQASAPAEFRISAAQPHFHGYFELMSVHVERVASKATRLP